MLCFTITPIPPSILVTFLIGAVLLILGMLLFNVCVESSMTPIGERVGSIMTRSKNLFIMVAICFIMGMIITISEPDLQVLAQQVPSIPNITLILAVVIGVGAFLVSSVLRMLFGIPLSFILLFFYGIIFIITIFVPADFLAIAFDSGGVASGPMTATFLLPFAMGACESLGGNIITDAFGIVSMVAMTPLIAIQIMGLVYRIKEAQMHKETAFVAPEYVFSAEDMEIIEL